MSNGKQTVLDACHYHGGSHFHMSALLVEGAEGIMASFLYLGLIIFVAKVLSQYLVMDSATVLLATSP